MTGIDPRTTYFSKSGAAKRLLTEIALPRKQKPRAMGSMPLWEAFRLTSARPLASEEVPVQGAPASLADAIRQKEWLHDREPVTAGIELRSEEHTSDLQSLMRLPDDDT